jgi:DNA topoisomerase I
MALKEIGSFESAAQANRNLRAAIAQVTARLGNTPTICRKCYVHPDVLVCYLDGRLIGDLDAALACKPHDEPVGLQREEAAVLAVLRAQLKPPGEDALTRGSADASPPLKPGRQDPSHPV